VALVFLSVNFGLLALVVWQLTGSRWGTLIVLFVIGINPSFSYAYFDTGAIYDVLAFTFFWGAFAVYVNLRRRGRPPGWGSLALIFGLFVLALDAKEIAVSLPAAVGLYELIWHPPASWRVSELWRWLRLEGRFAVIGGLADVAYVMGKRYGADSLWLVAAYRPHYSWTAYFNALAYYLQRLIYHPVHIGPWQTGVLLAAMLALAACTRRRSLLWGVGFILIGVLPLAFIPVRGGFAYLAPAAGWAVYLAGLLAYLLESAAAGRVWVRWAVQVLLIAALAAKLAPWQRRWLGMQASGQHDQQTTYRKYIEQIHALIPAPRKGARILLLSDAGGQDDWDVFFVIRLFYGDPKLDVTRGTVWRSHQIPFDPASYDYVLDVKDYRFFLVSHR
jgi:hypothetical protein